VTIASLCPVRQSSMHAEPFLAEASSGTQRIGRFPLSVEVLWPRPPGALRRGKRPPCDPSGAACARVFSPQLFNSTTGSRPACGGSSMRSPSHHTSSESWSPSKQKSNPGFKKKDPSILERIGVVVIPSACPFSGHCLSPLVEGQPRRATEASAVDPPTCAFGQASGHTIPLQLTIGGPVRSWKQLVVVEISAWAPSNPDLRTMLASSCPGACRDSIELNLFVPDAPGSSSAVPEDCGSLHQSRIV